MAKNSIPICSAWVPILILNLIVFHCIAPYVSAQRYSFRNYTGDDGLSQLNTLVIFQDREGYIWIGTEAGLNRFDGNTFEIFGIEEGIKNDRVNAIVQDHQGRLWIGTEGALSCWDGKNFKNYTREDGLPDPRVLTLALEENGNIWCGTRGGLSCWDGTKFCHFPDPKGLLKNEVNTLFIDRSKRLWAATRKGLFFKKGDRFVPFTAPALKDHAVTSLAEDDEGFMWVASTEGIHKFKGFRQVALYTHEIGLTTSELYSICPARDGTIWIGGNNGIFWIKNEKIQEISSMQGLDFRVVKHIIEDQEGIIWIGYAGGTAKFIGRAFTNYTMEDGLGSNIVRPIFRDRKGILWVGTMEGISQFDGKTWRNIVLAGDSDLNQIYSLFEDSRGIVWIGTFGGLMYHDGKEFYKVPELGKYRVLSIVEDKNGDIWASLFGKGIFIGDLRGFRFLQVPGQTFSNARLMVDKEKRIWIGGDNGLSVWNGAAWKTFTTSDGLAYNELSYICQDHDGNIWFGYNASIGFSCYDGKKFRTYTTRDGLFHNAVYSIGVDQHNNLWLGTARCVDKYDGKTFINYGTAEGYASNESNGGGFFEDRDGTLWFATAGGLSHYNPANDLPLREPPPVKIRSLYLGNEPVDIKVNRSVTVPYSRNDLRVRVACLSYINKKRLHLRYRLYGYDEDWQVLKGHNIIYTNLPPGHYRLEIQGRKYTYEWSASAAAGFTIAPPFWRTWWFYTLFGLFLVFSGVSVYRIREKKFEKRKKELEQLVDIRTNQLKEANKELEKLSIVASKTDNAVMIMDKNGNIEWINESFTRLYGVTLEQPLSKKGKNLRDISSNPDICNIIDKCIKNKETVIYEVETETRDCKKVWIQTTLTPIIGADEDITKLVAINSDITKLKQSQKEMEKANAIIRKEREAAEIANRAKSDFLARMSHEIRTPMNGVIGFTDMLLNTCLNEEQVDYARTISRCGEALMTILNDILDFSKIEAGELTFNPIDFDPEVTLFDVCELIIPRLGGKPVEVLCFIDDDVPAYVKSDAGRFQQVVVNLMGNAAKFTEKGEIQLSLHVEETGKEKLKLHVKVRDTGIGIPADKLNTIFEVFQQADSSTTRHYGGTGLGLAICKQISNLMGGEVWVESRLGKGSTFHFTAWVGVSEKKFGKEIDSDYLKGKHVLIVDNNHNNLKILAPMLERSKMRVDKTGVPAEVVALLRDSFDRHDPFDIVIMDINKPELNGYQVVREIRSLDSPVSRVPLLAYFSSTVEGFKKIKDLGFDEFLPKPSPRKKLLWMIGHLLQMDLQEEKSGEKDLVTQHTISDEEKRSVRILMAEDNPINRKLAKKMLTKAGYRLKMVNNGDEAVRTYTAAPESFNLIFMDVQMPKMDGKEATRLIRQKGFKEVPIIAITAGSMKGDREKCIEVGMNDYISKPIKREAVFKMVKKWCLQ